MKGLSLCKTLGSLLFLLAVCVLAVGCGGGGVDALVSEYKAAYEEMKAGGGDPAKMKTAMDKMIKVGEKIQKLNESQKKDFEAKIKKEIPDFKLP